MSITTKKLAGKVALVTGGSRGIGAAIAKRLAEDGANVAISYAASSEKAEAVARGLEENGIRAAAFKAEQGDPIEVTSLVKAVVEHFGRLDILVNNAAIISVSPIDEFSLDDFDRLVAVNIKGVFVATQEAVRHMGEGGRIIMIGSVNSDSVPVVGLSVYALTKGAVASFTRGLARDLGPRGITVNNVQPGPVDTDMNPAESDFAEKQRAFIAVHRYGRGEEVAAMVSYLAGPESAYVTGANLKIDGGFTA